MKKSRASLLVKYLVPTVLSNLSIFLFTIVDGIFVGRGVGSDALGAVNIVFPYIMFFNAAVMLTTIGGLTITAIRRGRGDAEGANEVFMHSIVMTLTVTVIFSGLAVFATEPLCRIMGADDSYIGLAKDYLFWYGVFLIPCGMLTMFNGFVRNDDRPGFVSIVVIIATGLNIFGDWLLIYPIQWGLKGAAIATGVSQTIGMGIIIWHFILKKGKLNFHRFRFGWGLFGKIALRGLPECIAQFGAPFTTVITNTILVERLGNASVNAYSIICYVASFSISIYYGVAEGMQPLFGRCYGQKNDKDLNFFKWIGLAIGGAGAIIVTVIVILLARPISVLYGASGDTLSVTVAAMSAYAWGFVLQSFSVVISSYLYSTTRTGYALVINILRSFVVNTAVTILLPLFFGANIIWYTFGIYEGIVMVCAFILMFVADRKGAIGKRAE